MYEIRVFPYEGEAMIVECVRVNSPFEAVDVAELVSKVTTRTIEVVDVVTGEVIRAFNVWEKAAPPHG